MACEATAFARAGLIGNPSDGYCGKTISFIIRNFSAKVSLYEGPHIEIVPSIQDRSKYASLDHLDGDVRDNGYYGGIRLMKATLRRFHRYCKENRIALHDRCFSVRYRSTIPRRLGLAGSSALVTATLRCLLEFYDIEIARPLLPGLILSVETEELGISAGLQDRVIQVYEGAVFMDFDKALFDKQGHGDYVPLDLAALPNIFIAYRRDLSEGSEQFHNNIRERWLAGDPEVVEAMKDFAGYAQEARGLLEAGRGAEIGPLLDANFDRRCSIYQMNAGNADMVRRARSAGAHAKLCGSGGAIVGVYEDEDQYARLAEAMEAGNIAVFKPEIEA